MAKRNTTQTAAKARRRSPREVLEDTVAKATKDIDRYTDLLGKARVSLKDAQKQLDEIRTEEKATAKQRIAEIEAELERLKALAVED